MLNLFRLCFVLRETLTLLFPTINQAFKTQNPNPNPNLFRLCFVLHEATILPLGRVGAFPV